jgi:hypothetical protein
MLFFELFPLVFMIAGGIVAVVLFVMNRQADD